MKTICKKYTLCCVMFFCAFTVVGQKAMTSMEAEKKTYQLYHHRNWSELIKVAKQSLDNGYDYYYMRMRLGVSYFEQQNYKLAEAHFKKALSFNYKSDVAAEYLYYCYLYTGRKEDARKLTHQFSLDLKDKIQVKDFSSVDFVMLEGAKKVVNSAYNEENSSTYFNDATYVQLGLKHFVNNKFSLFYAATYFGQKSYLGEVNQYQYFAQATVPLKNNWSIVPSLHLVNTDFKGEEAENTEDTINLNENYFVGSVTLKKNYQKWDFDLGTTYSNISDRNQYNHFGRLTYSVFGNSKLILGATGYAHTNDDYENVNLSLSPFLYVQANKALSFKANYLINKGDNIIEDNGYLVNNSIDLTENRLSLFVNYQLKTTTLYASYQKENKVESFNNFNYNYSLFLLGAKIGFGQ